MDGTEGGERRPAADEMTSTPLKTSTRELEGGPADRSLSTTL